MPAVPVVKPDRPMTLTDVDTRLGIISTQIRHYRVQPSEEQGSGVYLERAFMEADRLLDVRLAITKAEA